MSEGDDSSGGGVAVFFFSRDDSAAFALTLLLLIHHYQGGQRWGLMIFRRVTFTMTLFIHLFLYLFIHFANFCSKEMLVEYVQLTKAVVINSDKGSEPPSIRFPLLSALSYPYLFTFHLS